MYETRSLWIFTTTTKICTRGCFTRRNRLCADRSSGDFKALLSSSPAPPPTTYTLSSDEKSEITSVYETINKIDLGDGIELGDFIKLLKPPWVDVKSQVSKVLGNEDQY
ncbi:unnamed protein product [Absidia cylindrospora]